MGCECEFYLFETDDRGNPTKIPLDRGGYFDIAPLDKGEDIRREICFAMEDLGLRAPAQPPRERLWPERGGFPLRAGAALSGQPEHLQKHRQGPLRAATGCLPALCPSRCPDQAGSGLHVNLSLKRDGVNLFEGDIAPDSEPAHFMAGIPDPTPGS